MARNRWRSAAVVALAAVALGACSGTGYHYVKSSEDKTYFKVPDEWRLFDEDELLEADDSISPRERDLLADQTWQVAFDGDPEPALRHVLNPRAKYPSGIAIVEELDFDASSAASIESLRNTYVGLDEAVQNGTAEVILYEPLEPDGGFRGIHVVADVEIPEQGPVTYNQISLLDQSTSKQYTLFIACSSACYEEHESRIEKIADSWTVED